MGYAALGILLVALSVSDAGLCKEPEPKENERALPADNEWWYWSFERRHSMTFLIHLTMMEHFQAFYKTPTPELTCTSCHGEGAQAVGYNLSNSKLKALKPSRVRALYSENATLTPHQLFKRDDITPTMARLLGVPQYNPATGLEFSCLGCHRRENEQ